MNLKKDYIYPPETNLINMKKTFLVALASVMIIATIQSQTIKSPDEFLGYELGTQFTYHYKAVEYFKYIADISPLAEYREYGTTNEGPL